ncbi:putative aminoacrylate hydrolase RutD isoform X2 [Phoenix dactylifera]|uniref:Aminoacrylate hydrolase RutD isoform X2 n=2 Tax=Phoenix dactylifera TaxID=42345 RepID=A0A8B7CUF3_PHODC|nr:putative aminoacrylate hydrolase RutD isoform X2 [Phoenix dactylifera]
MPFCEVGKSRGEGNAMRIFYRRHGHGSNKVLLIIGLAATHDSWEPQIKGLTGTVKPNDEEEEEAPAAGGGGTDSPDEEDEGIEVCCFDNRGMGRSSVPTKKSECTTTIMAKDALALLDHLGWKKAHVFGHSMGAMIACKLAAIAPERLCSLALLNATGGGFECFPKIDRQMISLTFRFLRAKTPEQRALVDLEAHYTKEYLDEYVGSCTRRKILYQEYVKAISSTGMQSNSGFEGQINACWTHKMTPKELDTIRSSGFLVSVIHGRDDIIAQLNHARRLAEKLHPAARMVELHGGHLVSHERPEEVNQALKELIKASKSKLRPEDWSYLPEEASGWLVLGMPMSPSVKSNEGASGLVAVYHLLGKVQLSFLYFIGVFLMGFQHMRNVLRIMKPVRVAASDS